VSCGTVGCHYRGEALGEDGLKPLHFDEGHARERLCRELDPRVRVGEAFGAAAGQRPERRTGKAGRRRVGQGLLQNGSRLDDDRAPGGSAPRHSAMSCAHLLRGRRRASRPTATAAEGPSNCPKSTPYLTTAWWRPERQRGQRFTINGRF